MSTQDQNFFNLFMIVIGALIGVALLLVVVSRMIAGQTQQVWIAGAPENLALVDERIRPVGSVRLPGDGTATVQLAVAEVAAPVAAKLTGEQVYNTACFACHGPGVGGAPKLGDAADWSVRNAQGISTLNRHAIEGYQGQLGYMPPKGGRVDLSDEEIIASVAFMSGN